MMRRMNGWALVVALAGALTLGTLVGVLIAGLGHAAKLGDAWETEQRDPAPRRPPPRAAATSARRASPRAAATSRGSR